MSTNPKNVLEKCLQVEHERLNTKISKMVLQPTEGRIVEFQRKCKAETENQVKNLLNDITEVDSLIVKFNRVLLPEPESNPRGKYSHYCP